MSSFRITTNGLFQGYRSGLFAAKKNLSDTMKRVETHRSLNAYAEDPAKASQAFQRRRELWRTNDQIINNNYMFSKYTSAYTALQDIVDGNDNAPGLDGIKDKLEVLNDPDAGGRKALGQSLMAKADSIVHVMNITYGTDFVFGGADCKNVPFTWGDDGALLYHGVDVTCNALLPASPGNINMKLDEDVSVVSLKDFPLLDENGKQVFTDGKQITDAEGNPEFTYTPRDGDPITVYRVGGENGVPVDYVDAEGNPVEGIMNDLTSNPGNLTPNMEQVPVYDEKAYAQYKDDAITHGKALLAMADERTYIDLGLGMKQDVDGELLDSSAFDSALCGMKFLGYGVDMNGDPQNIVVLMRRLGELANSCDPNTGDFPAESGGWKEASRLAQKLRDAISRTSEQHVNLAAKAEYLEDNGEILSENQSGLNEQITALEDVDPADAITQMMYAQYCYNAALRIGNDILSQSLIDYMR